MSGIQIVGNANSSTAAEVETNTKAMRVVVRPDDWGSLGIYSVGTNNGTTGMAAVTTTAQPIVIFRNGGTNLAIVKRVLFSMLSGGTGFAAGEVIINMFRDTSYTAGPSGGTSFLPGASQNQLRSTMGTPTISQIQVATTASLTTGTRTVDTNPLTSIVVPVGTGTWTNVIPSYSTLWDQRVGEYPLVLAQNQGFEIQVTNPGTGVWFFGATILWEELAAY